MTAPRLAAARGFTLVELVIVMVLLGIAVGSVVALSGNIFKGLQENRDTLAKAQLTQECFEALLAKGRANFKDSVLEPSASPPPSAKDNANAFCQQFTLSGTSYGAPTVTSLIVGQSNAPSPNTIPACPHDSASGKSCKLITITHDSTAPIYLMLVEP